MSLSASDGTGSRLTFEEEIHVIHDKLDDLIKCHGLAGMGSLHDWKQAAIAGEDQYGKASQSSPWFIAPQNILLEKEIGEGSFAIAWEGSWAGTRVVVKQLTLRGCSTPDKKLSARTKFKAETDIWFKLNHVNVIKMFGACDAKLPFCVCEHAGLGQLDKVLVDSRRNNPSSVWCCLLNAALRIQYLHRVGIVHGDLKLNNILVGNDGIAKLTDFGLSLEVRDSNLPTGGAHGAWRWKASECLPSTDHPCRSATFESDVFSFAMCMIEAVSGKIPWASINDEIAVQFHILGGHIPKRPAAMTMDSMWGLVQRMTCFNASERVTMDYVVAHLYSFVCTLDMTRLHKEHGVVIYDSHVIDRPRALLAVLPLVTSSNKSIARMASNHLVLIQYYRLTKAAELNDIDAIVKFLRNEIPRVVKWAAVALGNLCWNNERNKDLVREAGGVPLLVQLLHQTEQKSMCQVAAKAAHVLTFIPDGVPANRSAIVAIIPVELCLWLLCYVSVLRMKRDMRLPAWPPFRETAAAAKKLSRLVLLVQVEVHPGKCR